jgi:hypothetical protein
VLSYILHYIIALRKCTEEHFRNKMVPPPGTVADPRMASWVRDTRTPLNNCGPSRVLHQDTTTRKQLCEDAERRRRHQRRRSSPLHCVATGRPKWRCITHRVASAGPNTRVYLSAATSRLTAVSAVRIYAYICVAHSSLFNEFIRIPFMI